MMTSVCANELIINGILNGLLSVSAAGWAELDSDNLPVTILFVTNINIARNYSLGTKWNRLMLKTDLDHASMVEDEPAVQIRDESIVQICDESAVQMIKSVTILSFASAFVFLTPRSEIYRESCMLLLQLRRTSLVNLVCSCSSSGGYHP